MAREEKIMVRLDPDVKREFQELCKEYGMTMSAYAAYLIGKEVRIHKKVVNPMIGDMREVMQKIAERAMKDAED